MSLTVLALHIGPETIVNGLRAEDGVVLAGNKLIENSGILAGTAVHRVFLENGAVRYPGFHFVCLRRVGEEAHRQHRAQHRRKNHHPEFGLAVVQHTLDSLLDPHLAKGQGAGGNGVPWQTALQQGGGIGLFVPGGHVFDDRLVAGLLNVPAEEYVSQSAQGIEPVNAEQGIPQGLPQVVAPAQMGPLMGEHQPGRCLVHIGG